MERELQEREAAALRRIADTAHTERSAAEVSAPREDTLLTCPSPHGSEPLVGRRVCAPLAYGERCGLCPQTSTHLSLTPGEGAGQASAAANKEYAHKIETRLALSTPSDNHNQELLLRTKAKLREQRDAAATEAAAAKELCR